MVTGCHLNGSRNYCLDEYANEMLKGNAAYYTKY
jgi:hypothetical protein